MEDIFKYHRLQGQVQELLQNDRITSATVENNTILLGTESGHIHVIHLDKQDIKTIHAHDRAVNAISVDLNGYLVASCSDNGTVIINNLANEEDKGTQLQFNEPIKSVFVDIDENPKKEKSILVGTASGKLIHNRQMWFSNKNVVLFNGTGSPVTAISWKSDIVAWADLSLVRIMNITTQSAICYVSSPSGVGIQNPFPCHFFWESERELFIAWADNIRHIEFFTTRSTSGNDEHHDTVAKTSREYQMDCIVCGLSSFDREHLIILGYVPPEEEIFNAEDSSSNKTTSTGPSTSVTNRPEVKIMKRSDAEIITCDILPMTGQVLQGPWDYLFLTTHMNQSKRRKKSVIEPSLSFSSTVSTETSAMSHSHLPILFILSPQDIIIGKIRDVNDRIGLALQQGDLYLAVNLAFHDRNSLRHYHYHDIVSLYVEDLLQQNQIEYCITECIRLINNEPILWERWIYYFIKHGHIIPLLPHIPVNNPRLSQDIYQVILETLFIQHSDEFYKLLIDWNRVRPVLLHYDSLIMRLESATRLDNYHTEGLAMLYMWCKRYDKALSCYLDEQYQNWLKQHNECITTVDQLYDEQNITQSITAKTIISTNNGSSGCSSSIGGNANPRINKYGEIYQLIEKYDKLFDLIKNRLVYLFRLSIELTLQLLLKYIDKFPIPQVVEQIKTEKYFLYHYLHFIFKKFEPYNSEASYGEYHLMQISLYAEFSPRYYRSQDTMKENNNMNSVGDSTAAAAGGGPSPSKFLFPKSMGNENDQTYDNFAELIDLRKNYQKKITQFMIFLQTSKFYPLDYALRECEKRKPPLYYEMVYILDSKGMKREALNLLLREIGDMRQAVDFIEKHEELQQPELWNDIVDYCIQNPIHLSNLLDYLGICNLNASSVIAAIPKNIDIPALRLKILRIIKQYRFQVNVTNKCNLILEDDALYSLKRLKQTARRALKIDPTNRCALCAKPLFVPQENIDLEITGAAIDSLTSQYQGHGYKIWGNANKKNGVVAFSNKHQFHRECFEYVQSYSGLPAIITGDAL